MELKSLLNTRDLTVSQISHLITFAQAIKKRPETFSAALKGKVVANFFVENSTRTKTSFEVATRKLGGSSLGFTPGTSSLTKGETLMDTASVLKQNGPDLIVIRHSSSGAPLLVHQATGLPVVNAGDGTHEHPTQALLDAMTLAEHWNVSPDQMQGKKVLIIGDILHSRVARSNIHALSKLGVQVTLCAPLTLLPDDLSLFPRVEVVHRLDQALGKKALLEADAVMCLRIQFERQHGKMHIPSKEEYRHFWGLTADRAKELRPKTAILHPGPMNQGLEIDAEVANSNASIIEGI